MKKYILILACFGLLWADSVFKPPVESLRDMSNSQRPLVGTNSQSSQANGKIVQLIPHKDDFEGVTPRFQIRNIQNGIALNVQRHGDFNTQNWLIRDFGLDPEFMRGKDPLRNTWNFGYIQFVTPTNHDVCLGIGEDGFLHLLSCTQDVQGGLFETVFSLIPTPDGAVQIRSMVLEKNECLTAFENPNVPIEKRFGIQPCSLDFDFLIDTSELFFIAPMLVEARPLAR